MTGGNLLVGHDDHDDYDDYDDEGRVVSASASIPYNPMIFDNLLIQNIRQCNYSLISIDHSYDQLREGCQSHQSVQMAPLQSVLQGEWTL